MSKGEWKLIVKVGGLFLVGMALSIGALYLKAYVYATVARDIFQ